MAGSWYAAITVGASSGAHVRSTIASSITSIGCVRARSEPDSNTGSINRGTP